MLSVFVCDDDPMYLQGVSEGIRNYICMEELDINMTLCTANPAEIIRYIRDNKVNGLYFLDIELAGGGNGVEIAKAIRQYDPRGFIVFITSHLEYLPLTFEYKVEALAYIQKEAANVVREKICGCIADAYNKHVSRSDEGCYIFKTQGGRKISCGFDDILFFETDAPGSKRIILHTKKRQYKFYGSLNEAMAALPVGLFFKCHKSYVVNVSNLTESCIDDLNQGKDYIVMSNGAICFVSARNKRSLLRSLADAASIRQRDVSLLQNSTNPARHGKISQTIDRTGRLRQCQATS